MVSNLMRNRSQYVFAFSLLSTFLVAVLSTDCHFNQVLWHLIFIQILTGSRWSLFLIMYLHTEVHMEARG